MAVTLQIAVPQAVDFPGLQHRKVRMFSLQMRFTCGADCHVSSCVITKILLFSQCVLG